MHISLSLFSGFPFLLFSCLPYFYISCRSFGPLSLTYSIHFSHRNQFPPSPPLHKLQSLQKKSFFCSNFTAYFRRNSCISRNSFTLYQLCLLCRSFSPTYSSLRINFSCTNSSFCTGSSLHTNFPPVQIPSSAPVSST